MDGYQKSSFAAKTAKGHLITHDIYSKGAGPVVVIIQELPGIGPETLHLADKFEAEGFTVVLPHLFGPLGKTSVGGNLLRVMCMRREFRLFAKGKSSPVVDWLRALCQKLKQDHDVPGVATIGMCLTGNFAISLMADDAVLAGVASQPSMPVNDQHALHMSNDDVAAVREKLDQVGPMKAYRIEGDNICKAEKFAALDRTFNDDKQRIELNTLPGKGHSVLTLDFVDEDGHPTKEAFDNIVGYFRKQLAA